MMDDAKPLSEALPGESRRESGRRLRLFVLLACALVALAVGIPWDGPKDVLLPIPEPLAFKSEEGRVFNRGRVRVAAVNRIIVRDGTLGPITEGLKSMLWTLADLDLRVVRTRVQMEAQEGDIVLSVDAGLPEEGYVLSSKKVIRIAGGSPTGVAWGLSSLIQLGQFRSGAASFPRVGLSDRPAFPYRGLMVDVARKPYSLDELKELVVLAHLYKVRYLHLHLTDDQAFTFPATTVEHVRPWRTYEVEELEELQAFAEQRGVTVIPEVDLPGHSQALVDSDPELFALPARSTNPRTVHMGREDVYEALDTIIGEIAQVFSASPYLHIGGDEASLAGFESDPETQDFLEAQGLDSVEELQRYFIARAADMVRRRGKRPVVWEGFGEGSVEIPADVLVMAWETAYRLPDALLADGYEIVNVSWKPLYVAWGRRFSFDDLVRWSPYRWENWFRPTPSYEPIEVPETDAVLGGQMAVWEQDGFLALPALRGRIPVVAEKLWRGELSTVALNDRMKRANGLLGLSVRPALVLTEGGMDPGYEGPQVNRRDWFADAVTVRAEPVLPGDRVLATFDGTLPDEAVDKLEGPRRISESGPVRFQVVDQAGRARGVGWTRYFERRPIEFSLKGGLPRQDGDPSWTPDKFTSDASVVLSQLSREGTLRYTVDGSEPSAESAQYEDAIAVTETTRLRAQVFDEQGGALGEAVDETFAQIPTVDHLAMGRPVTTYSGDPAAAAAAWAVDGLLDRTRNWGTDLSDQERYLEVDLGALVEVGEVRVYTYWDGARSYQYRVNGSRDQRSWMTLVDESDNTTPATDAGYSHQVDNQMARWIRLEFVEPEGGGRGHLVELAVLAEGTVLSEEAGVSPPSR
ncbi:MAG: family 20 glycosylhydrolase [Longimicrobiales bacterium]